MDNFIDKIASAIINPIVHVIGTTLSFIVSQTWLAVLVGGILVNIVGFILMKKDKEYAQNDKRRVRERTLIATAAVGGSLGIYFGMYKFKHKTLKRKFTILVPIIMLLQAAFITYEVFSNLF